MTCHLLSQVVEAGLLPKEKVGGFRDDLLFVTDLTPRQNDVIKKKLCELFTRNGFSIEIKVNKKVVDYLDIKFDLDREIFQPFKKPNDEISYVHKDSNHPPKITKNIPPSVQKRLSGISANKEVFDAAAPDYQLALNNAGYKHKLEFDETVHDINNNNTERRKKKRKRNLTYFTPPYSMTVKTRIGKLFLKIVEESFPPDNPLHRKLSKHNLKLSYSCVPNMKSRISRHNQKIRDTARQAAAATRVAGEQQPAQRQQQQPEQQQQQQPGQQRSCNCRVRRNCPLNNRCLLATNVIYQSTIVRDEDGHVETYLGASQHWKTRYTTGHARDERDPNYRHATTRAEYLWQLKDEGKTYSETWRIIDRASRYNPITKRCNLCLKEKVYIIFHRNLASLNKRVLAEFYQPCLHRFQTFLAKA